MDKIKGMVNPDNIDENYEDDYVFDGDDNAQDAGNGGNGGNNGGNRGGRGNYGYDNGGDYNGGQQGGYTQQSGQYGGTQQQPQQPAQGGGLSSSALELKVVKPERYDVQTAQKIADHLLNRRTVVLNLELTNKESARRLIDFLSGVAYSIDGYMQRVANNTFVVVPNNVDISGEQLQDPQPQRQINTDDIY